MQAPSLSIEIVAEIASLQSDMERVKRTVGDMSGSVGRSTKAVNDNFRGMGAGVDRISSEMMKLAKVSQDTMTRVNAVTGVTSDTYKRSAADIEEYGRKLDTLRAKYNPQFAVIQRYRNELAEVRQAYKVGAISADEMAAAQSRLRQSSLASLKTYKTQSAGVMQQTNAQRAGFQQLSYQIGDVTTMYSLGARPMQIFASQASQVTQAIGLMSSSSKGLIGFIGGPWGQVLIGAVTVLGTLGAAYWATKDATDANSDASETLADKLSLTKHSYDEVIAATREYNDEAKRAGLSSLQMADAAAKAAKSNYDEALSTREKTKALLELYEAELRYRERGGNATDSTSAASAVGVAAADVRTVRSRIAEMDKDIADLRTAIGNTAFDYANEIAKLQSDPVAKITHEYERQREALRGTITDTNELSRALTDLYRKEEAAKARLRDTDKPSRTRNGQPSLPEVTLAEVERILERDLGAVIGSTTRSARENARVGGAANSYHLTSQAIDLPFSKGRNAQITKEDIRRVLAAEGIDIRELLSRGDKDHDDHTHLAFSRKRLAPDRLAALAQKEAEAARKEMEKLEQFGYAASESILRINERFDEQPRLIDQAAMATRQLDGIIAELGERKPVGFEQMIADAQTAKQTVEDALLRPLNELFEASERRLQIGDLIASGREAEAEALQEVWRLESLIGPLTQQQKEDVRDLVEYERQRVREQERQRDLLNAQLGVLDNARNSLQDLLSGRKTDILGNLGQSIRDLQGARLFDRLFGDVFDQLEAEFSNSPIAKANRDYADSVERTSTQTDVLETELRNLAGVVNATSTALTTGTPVAANDNGVITVTGPKRTEIEALSIAQIADKTAAGIVGPLLAGFEDVLGTKFMMNLSGVLEGALSGYIRGGKVGGVLGGLQGLTRQFGEQFLGRDLAESLSKNLGTALDGAQTGNTISYVGDALGIKNSRTGAQLGGAIGSFIPIPGGDLIGSIAGGLLGGLFKKKPYGTASLNGLDGLSVSGLSDGSREGASSLGSAVQDALASVLDALDADLGNFAVSIGTYKDRFRVSTRGATGKLGGYSGSAAENERKYGLYDFATEGEAIAFAIADAIKDGAIKGLSAAEKRLLNNKDIEQAVQDIVDFRSVFDRLKQIKDPVQYELDELNEEFEGLKNLFQKAGASAAEYAQLEELYGLERKKILEQTNEDLLASLRGLLDDLTIGDSGLSLRDRQANALTEYNDLKSRVEGGDSSAYQEFADIARSLLDIERQLYGSTQGYFDRLSEVTDLTRSRIEGEDNVQALPIPQADTPTPFDSAPAVVHSVERQTNDLLAGINTLNNTQITTNNLLAQIARQDEDGRFQFQQFVNAY